MGVGVRCVYCRRGTFTADDAFSAPFSYVLPKGAFCTDGLTEKCTLYLPSHGKAHSATAAASRKTALCAGDAILTSRKSAFWAGDVTENRILRVGLTKKRIL